MAFPIRYLTRALLNWLSTSPPANPGNLLVTETALPTSSGMSIEGNPCFNEIGRAHV